MKIKKSLNNLDAGNPVFLDAKEIAVLDMYSKIPDYTLAAVKLNISPAQVQKILLVTLRKLSCYCCQFKNQPDTTQQKEIQKLSVHDFLQAPLIIHHLSPRLHNALSGLCCKNLYEVLQYNSNDLLKLRGIGKKSLDELRNLLAKNNCEHLLKSWI